MGVNHLWRLIKPAEQIAELTGKSLAVDVSIWIHQLADLKEYQLVLTATKRIIKIAHFGIKPIFVFDGETPAQKMKEIRRRREKKARKELQAETKTKSNDKLNFENKTKINKEKLRKIKRKSEIWDEQYEEVIECEANNKLKTKSAKLRRLLELREKRGESLGFDTSGLNEFSLSQLANLKKRNAITALIKEITMENEIKRRNITEEKKLTRNEQEIADEIEELTREFNRQKEKEDSWDEEIEIPKTYEEINRNKNNCDKKYIKINKYSENNRTDDESDEEISKIMDNINKMRETACRRVIPDGKITEITNKIKEIVSMLGFSCVDSPYEADSQCAKLCRDGLVDGVISEDSDILLYAVPVYKNFFRRNKEIGLYTPEGIASLIGWCQVDLIKLSWLLGSDYTSGIHGIGPARAVKMLEDVNNDDIKELCLIYTKPVGHSFAGFVKEKVSKSRIRNYLESSGLRDDKVDEIMFYVSSVL